jgi:hypothetical protein
VSASDSEIFHELSPAQIKLVRSRSAATSAKPAHEYAFSLWPCSVLCCAVSIMRIRTERGRYSTMRSHFRRTGYDMPTLK